MEYQGFDYYYAKYPYNNKNKTFHSGFYDAWSDRIFGYSGDARMWHPMYKIGWDAGTVSRKERRLKCLLLK